MGRRFTSRFRRLIGAFAPIPLFGLGYITADPSSFLLRAELLMSGEGSAHHRSVGLDQRPLEATGPTATLFAKRGKGPRADHYAEKIRTSRIAKQPASVMAALAPLDVEITGSIGAEEHTINRRRKTGSLRRESALQTAQAQISAPLMMASLAGSTAYTFSRARAALAERPEQILKNSGPSKISRGLVFQGESEDEYQARQRRCLATAIYFEARGEPMRGQLAVAQVVMNRVRTTRYADTICGVVYQGQWQRKGCQFSFACDGQADVPRDKRLWALANTLAKRVTEGKVWLTDIGHATHYHATYVKPRWRRDMNRIKKIGQHIFYIMPQPQIREAEAVTTSPDQGPV